MVTEGKLFIELLHHPYSIDSEEANLINQMIKKYPFLQQAHLLHTLYMKNQDFLYQNALQQTAARTTDRRRLYEIIHFEEKETGKKQKLKTSKQQNLPSLKKNSIEVFIPENTNKTSGNKRKKTTANKPEKLSYLSWLKQLKRIEPEKNSDIFDAIDKFIKDKPKIIPKRNFPVKTPDIIEKSIAEKQTLMTETLADLYVKQKKYDKAIQAFRILSLKYPKKSSYFANRIKEVKKLK